MNPSITATVVRKVDKYVTQHIKCHSCFEEVVDVSTVCTYDYGIKFHGYKFKEIKKAFDNTIANLKIYDEGVDEKMEDNMFECVCEAYTWTLLALGFRNINGKSNNTEEWELVNRAKINALLAKPEGMSYEEVQELFVL